MKYLDFVIQSIIFILGILMLIAFRTDADWPMGILYAQLLLGPWQMISSLISIVAKAPLYQQKKMHFFIALVYLAGLYGYMNADPMIPHSATLGKIIFTVPAWGLGIFYYILTWRWVFASNRRKGNFLPNLNF